eukprot:m.85338 g.85338  ORF g.85338 m.85338 type:complete len:225 (-) comp13005_c0_seq2:1893-2567(-)
MSVPTEFNEIQRNATIKAGALAGLEIVSVLSEPTAAALAYGLHEQDKLDFIIVYDFGGGTLDVSLLNKRGGMFYTFAVAGNKNLGGEDLTHRLYMYMLDYVNKLLVSPTLSLLIQQNIRSAADKVKLILSNVTSTTMNINLGEEIAFLDGTKKSSIEITITRAQFEDMCADLFNKTMQPLPVVDTKPSKFTDIMQVMEHAGQIILWPCHALSNIYNFIELATMI